MNDLQIECIPVTHNVHMQRISKHILYRVSEVFSLVLLFIHRFFPPPCNITFNPFPNKPLFLSVCSTSF